MAKPKQPNGHSMMDLVLTAAAELATRKPSFTLEDLAAACFHEWPRVFALKGYSAYPDARKVSNQLFGYRGLVAQGHLIRKDRLYSVSEEVLKSYLEEINNDTGT